MRWVKGNAYYLKSDGWTIAKCLAGDSAKYLLWRDRELVGVFDDADEAKREAKKGTG